MTPSSPPRQPLSLLQDKAIQVAKSRNVQEHPDPLSPDAADISAAAEDTHPGGSSTTPQHATHQPTHGLPQVPEGHSLESGDTSPPGNVRTGTAGLGDDNGEDIPGSGEGAGKRGAGGSRGEGAARQGGGGRDADAAGDHETRIDVGAEEDVSGIEGRGGPSLRETLGGGIEKLKSKMSSKTRQVRGEFFTTWPELQWLLAMIVHNVE
jgi:hypothetical protein